MSKNKFIISFFPGSSGRFLALLLNRLLLQIDTEIKICNNNSAHDNITYTGQYIPNFTYIGEIPIINDIYWSHDFPNYNLENITNDIKERVVILVRLVEDDIKEIIFNDLLKNLNLKLQNKNAEMLKKFYFLNKNNHHYYNINSFMSKISNFNNVIEISYQSIYEKENDNYKLLKILIDITGIENIPKSCYTALETYIKNRNELVQKYNLR